MHSAVQINVVKSCVSAVFGEQTVVDLILRKIEELINRKNLRQKMTP